MRRLCPRHDGWYCSRRKNAPDTASISRNSASDDIGSGRFIVRCLGAERYLDANIVNLSEGARLAELMKRQSVGAPQVLR
jgi:hypothetical protein